MNTEGLAESSSSKPEIPGLTDAVAQVSQLIGSGQHEAASSLLRQYISRNLPSSHPSSLSYIPGVIEGEAASLFAKFENSMDETADDFKFLSALIQFTNPLLRLCAGNNQASGGMLAFVSVLNNYFSKNRPHDKGHFADYLLKIQFIYNEAAALIEVKLPPTDTSSKDDAIL